MEPYTAIRINDVHLQLKSPRLVNGKLWRSIFAAVSFVCFFMQEWKLPALHPSQQEKLSCIRAWTRALNTHDIFLFAFLCRGVVTMTQPCMLAYSLLLIKTCHRRGVHAMGGMAAQIPIKNDPKANEAALLKVKHMPLLHWLAEPHTVALLWAVLGNNRKFTRRGSYGAFQAGLCFTALSKFSAWPADSKFERATNDPWAIYLISRIESEQSMLTDCPDGDQYINIPVLTIELWYCCLLDMLPAFAVLSSWWMSGQFSVRKTLVMLDLGSYDSSQISQVWLEKI